MNNELLVSTVIICFNTEKFVSEAIESVIAQTYSNWELLLVDDGSTDNSSIIMKNYAHQYSEKIRYLEHPEHQNRGKNASRNLGIINAKGEYIALLDSDDIWLPQKLTQQVELFKQYPEAGMIYGQAYLWYDWTKKPKDRQKKTIHSLPLGINPNTLIAPPQLLLSILEESIQIPTICSLLIRREVFQQVGLFDANFHDIYEDQVFLVKVLHQIPVFVSDSFWARYRQHNHSSMSTYNFAVAKNINVKYYTRLNFFKSVKAYLIQQQTTHLKILHYVNDYISNLEKKVYIFSFPFTFQIFTFWLRFIKLVMWIGHHTLPFNVRDWLWKKIGSRLHQ